MVRIPAQTARDRRPGHPSKLVRRRACTQPLSAAPQSEASSVASVMRDQQKVAVAYAAAAFHHLQRSSQGVRESPAASHDAFSVQEADNDIHAWVLKDAEQRSATIEQAEEHLVIAENLKEEEICRCSESGAAAEGRKHEAVSFARISSPHMVYRGIRSGPTLWAGRKDQKNLSFFNSGFKKLQKAFAKTPPGNSTAPGPLRTILHMRMIVKSFPNTVLVYVYNANTASSEH
ncbi:hypothetical protein M433DRAFT_174690 [Acidomyces richmondensis BFW]|nr:hypothetical protein M433DRAFT_174690 [Acidomyces richmondensis BFW]